MSKSYKKGSQKAFARKTRRNVRAAKDRKVKDVEYITKAIQDWYSVISR